MSLPNLHFIGRDVAAPELVLRWCRCQWPERLPNGLVFCVPTALSMRRLRDALTASYRAFHGVHFVMPAGLLAYFSKLGDVAIATQAEMLCVWDSALMWLQEMDSCNELTTFLFPGKREWLGRPAARYAVAKRLLALRSTLVEAGLDFSTVATHSATHRLESLREQRRWDILAVLEVRVREILHESRLEDPIDIQLRTFQNPVAQKLETATQWRLIMACVPDFMPALKSLLQSAPRCDILIQADPCEKEFFDSFGLPDVERWARKSLELPLVSIHVTENPSEEASFVDHFFKTKGSLTSSSVCLGVLDHAVMPALTAQLEERGMTLFQPEPISLVSQQQGRALKAMVMLARGHRPEQVLPLISFPEIPALFHSGYADLRAAYNRVVEKHLPGSLEALYMFTEQYEREVQDCERIQIHKLRMLLQQCIQWVNVFQCAPVKGAREFIRDIYGDLVVNPAQHELQFATFEALHSVLEEIEGLRVELGQKAQLIDSESAMELLLARLEDVNLNPLRRGADCSYEGRMEVLWSASPNLVLAGLNEGIFPDTSFDDVFLPNDFRQKLGLRSDANRLARDAYILFTAVACRKPENVCLLCARSNVRGDWLKPSRLFFRNTAVHVRETLARRLFVDDLPNKRIVGSETGLSFLENPRRWRKPDQLRTITASMIKAFLCSPLEYWLTYRLHVLDTDPLPEGITAQYLGTFLHRVLEMLSQIKDGTEEKIASRLIMQLHEVFRTQYGEHPEVPVLAGLQSAETRLREAARVEVRSREQGWTTRYIESQTHMDEWNVPFNIGDGRTVFLSGQIDRIDFSETLGWRVIDYKTAARGKLPAAAHWRNSREGIRWMDFQLPIYRLMVRHALHLDSETPLTLAYFLLPERSEATIAEYEDPPGGEAETETALRATLRAMLALEHENVPADVGEFGNTFLARLTKNTESIS